MSTTTHLAIDLGAGSGRVMAGHFDGKKLRIEEINRFANDGVRLPTGWHWNLLQLFTDIKRGLAEANKRHGASLVSLAVDTWGVDYGLIDKHGRLLGEPWMYRDSRTDGMMDEAAKILPREDIYNRTGIQFMFFNTLFQLLAEARKNPEAVAAADQLLFTPDLLTYWLSGERVVERTIASTSQLLKAGPSARCCRGSWRKPAAANSASRRAAATTPPRRWPAFRPGPPNRSSSVPAPGR